jgi:putative transposase
MSSNRHFRRKGKRLGIADVISAEDYEGQPVNSKIELIRALVPLGLMAIKDMLEQEVCELAGARYGRGSEVFRHGTNPGSVALTGQRHPIRVPRLRVRAGGEMPLSSWAALQTADAPDERLLKRVLYGLSCRNYEAAAEAIPGAIGLARSSVSRGFVEASAAKLREFQERSLSRYDVVALLLDGKTFAEDSLVVALGITVLGGKILLGFVQTATENERVLTPFLRSLIERGLDPSAGLLVVIDGAKGLRAAALKAFNGKCAIQRCQWHKRQNVVAHLPKSEQAAWRKRLQRAYERPTYSEAKAALTRLQKELSLLNTSAAASLDEGFEETLTLHRLGLFQLLGVSLKTTNGIESVFSQVERYCSKVSRWSTSNQKQRWLAASLLDVEPRLRKLKGFRHLPQLRQALQRELKINLRDNQRAA